MKKKILALACAMTLVFGMSLTVSAEESNSAGSAAEEAQEVVSVENKTGQTLTGAAIEEFAKTTTVISGVSGASIGAVSNDTAKAMISEANRVVGQNAFVAAVVDLQVPAGTGAATFTIGCPNVWKGQKVTIIHQKSDGTFETIAPDKVDNNAVTFTMTSYSPIALVVDAAAPKTADAGMATAAMLSVMSLAGLAVFGKKARA